MVLSSEGARERVRSSDLLGYRACGMLGAAGLGKTYELSFLAGLDRERGLDVRFERLAELGQTPDGLASRLGVLVTGATENTVIYLDALDEVMVPVSTTGLILARWIRDNLAAKRPALRISCRSAVWPHRVEAAIREVYGEEECAFAILQALSIEDVKSIAFVRGLDADDFVAAVDATGAVVLSEQPLTLEMLLRVYLAGGSLPTSRSELFAKGVQILSSERPERLNDGTAINIGFADLVEAAERLACFCLLSARGTVDLNDSPSSSSLGLLELEGLPGGTRPLGFDLLRAVGRSGLCDSDGDGQFRFAHRQFAEYLAGRRLARLLPHQSRALLSSGLGWPAGVAGPLRETAAFAAIESTEIAAWVTDHDPEVVGLSDVADDALRRRATLNLLSEFRRHALTDAQIGRRDGIQLAGFRYAGAERDLRPVLRERGADAEDVLECAIEMIESWNLASMSDDLADVVLDAAAPQHARKSAGYALARIGTPESRRRLLPLVADGPGDPHFDLKGLALRCNWSDGLTVSELLAALTPPRVSNYHGAYDGFLFALDGVGFDAPGHRLAGLTWARQFVHRDGDYDLIMRIAKRIAIASLDEIDEPGMADALAELLLEAAKVHARSPLIPPRAFSQVGEAEDEQPAVLEGRLNVRRKLIDALATLASEDLQLWSAARETPGLLASEDFSWLLERSIDGGLPVQQRENYAELARLLPWQDSVRSVEAWLAARESEPVASRLCYPLYIELDSEEAAKARKAHAEAKRWNRSPRRKRLRPSPAERVEQVLALSETKDPGFFLNLCRELTLEDYSTHYRFERFLSRTPGWAASDSNTKDRILESAKRLLTTNPDEPDRVRSRPLNTSVPGYMSAIWLVLECEPAWIDALPASWWQRWTWYILRELPLHTGKEPQALTARLLHTLHERAPGEVREAVEELATSPAPEARNLVTSLLELLGPIDDAEIDARLSERLVAADIPEDRIVDVAQFVLSRNNDCALPTCLSLLEPEAATRAETSAVLAAVALLHERTPESWDGVLELLERRRDLAPRVLSEFAHGRRLKSRQEGESSGLTRLTFNQVGQLLSLLIEAFPPDNDPIHAGAYNVGADDSARQLRDSLINWLGDQRDIEAIEALRMLEHRFGERHPWLRRPRARAEQAYRLSRCVPIPARTVAEMLAAGSKRLIRSGADALEGIVAAIEQYATQLGHGGANDLDDLWNRPTKGSATPKEEERVSDKVCAAIRNYFRDYAIAADREVQIFRRKLPRGVGGAPGSEVDVLCRVPAAGAVNGDPIAIPIEVKLSHNREARTGLRDQLVDRYMSQLGTSLGVFVVAWMGTPTPAAGYRRLWASPLEAQEELARQAREAMSSAEGLEIRTVVIDASLPIVPKRQRAGKRTKRNRGAKSAKSLNADSTGKKPKNVKATTDAKPSKAVKGKKKAASKRSGKKIGAGKKERQNARPSRAGVPMSRPIGRVASERCR